MAFLRGSITKVAMHNFMTHADCELRPGPKLNMIIGSNGSGKSSVVCAILLGLGGEPKDLGRSTNINAYIKTGTERGWIEIELYESTKGTSNPVVKRVIERGSKENSRGESIWFWNNDRKSLAFVRESLSSFGIDVSSLCQVLPQDRVGDFSKFSPVRLLDETIRATLTERYIRLKEQIYEENLKVGFETKLLEKKKKALSEAVAVNSKLEQSVQKLKERQKIETKLDLLQKLRPWLMYQARESEIYLLEKAKKGWEARIEQHQDSRELWEENIGTWKQVVKNQSKKSVSKMTTLRKTFDTFPETRRQVEQQDHSFKRSLQELYSVFEHESTATKRVAEVREKVLTIEEALKNFTPYQELRQSIMARNQKLNPLRESLIQLNTTCSHKLADLSFLNKQIAKVESRLQNVESEGVRKQRFIQQRGGYDMEKTYQYVSNLQETDQLKSHVFGPLFMEIETNNPMCAKLIENSLSASLLRSYITQNAADRTMLMKSGKLNVNNIELDDDGSNSIAGKFPKLSTVAGYQKLVRMGILGYAFEFLSCNKVVLEAILRVSDLGHVLLASSQFEDHLIRDPEAFTTIQRVLGKRFMLFSPTTAYKSTVSKYSGEKLLSMNSINLRRGKGFQGQSLLSKRQHGKGAEPDDRRSSLVDASRELDQMLVKRKALETEFRTAEQEKHIVQEKVKELSADLSELNKEKNAQKKLESRLKSARVRESVAMKETERDFRAEAKETKEELTLLLDNRSETVMGLVRSLGATESKCGASFSEQMTKLAEAEFNLALATGESKICRREEGALSEILDQKKSQIGRLETEAQEERRQLDEDIPLSKYGDEFKRIGIRDLGVLETAIDDLEAELATVFSDPSLLLRFETTRKDIARLEPEISKISEALTQLESSLATKQQRFEKAIKLKVKVITDKYSAMFKSISDAGYKCEGFVRFIKNAPMKQTERSTTLAPGYKQYVDAGGNDLNSSSFDKTLNYGIAIFVKFRESQHLEMLNAEVQSGGERSLSTFLYLLSLQDCSSAPFRVVDEINQGMDAHKERLAFHCLESSSCRDDLPQYFLITPKLLRGLKYNPTTQINVVYNGYYAPKQNAIAMDTIVERLLKHSRKRSSAGKSSDGGRPSLSSWLPKAKSNAGREAKNLYRDRSTGSQNQSKKLKTEQRS